jgi:hypothetical protein
MQLAHPPCARDENRSSGQDPSTTLQENAHRFYD